MALTIEIPRMNCCSFCNAPGHRIDKCTHPSIETIDQNILNAVALSTMFFFVGSAYIEFTLSRCSLVELKALRYKFKLSENTKKLVNTKRGLVEYLVLGYKNMGCNIDMYEKYILPRVKFIERGVEFIPEDPYLLPSDEVISFADRINVIFPNRPNYFRQILSWYAEKMRLYNTNKNNYLLQRQPHKFNINTLVSPINDLDKIFDCPICYQEELEPICSVKMTCGHIYCTACMENYLENKSKEKTQDVVLRCGMCRGLIEDIHFKDIEKANTIKDKYFN
jgi:hypothetical protein